MTGFIAETMPRTVLPAVASCGVAGHNGEVSAYLREQSISQRVFAAFLLVPVVPVIGMLIVLIRCTSRGPGILRQPRVGRHGAVYTMYKLRTMRCDAESATGPVWSTCKDARRTWLGRLLRIAHLDELPQLINVLKGDMSLVGPRPERPEFVNVLEEKVPGYSARLSVLPGITGLAQVNLPSDTNIASVQRKVRLDVEYIRTADLLLDVQIILCTFLKVFLIPSAWRIRLTGVDRSACLAGIDAAESQMTLTPNELAKPQHNGHPHPALDELPHKPR